MVLFLGLMTCVPGTCSSLVLYTFTASDPQPVTSSDPNLTASPLSRIGVTDAVTGGLFYTGTDWPVAAFSAAYYELTVAPHAGYYIDFSSVDLDYTIGTNPTFTSEVLTSLDGYTTPVPGTSHVSSAGSSPYNDSLASLGQQSGPVTLRIYGYVDSNFGASGLYAGSLDLASAGPAVIATATPEPASFALFGAGGLALLAARRRRRH
jgi:hypothetical protein